jgi:hypothetical protein
METMRRMVYLALALGTCGMGCGDTLAPVIASNQPLNRATAVAPEVQPEVQVAAEARVETTTALPLIELNDLTTGARIGGQVAIEGSRLSYHPAAPLPEEHRFELVVQREAISGSGLLDVDGSEWPEEALSWPYRLRFSTFSHPRVRAVYLDRSQRLPRLFVRFSQDMEQVVTSDQFALFDQSDEPVPLAPAVWVDGASVRLDITVALDPAMLYLLRIDRRARAADGLLLDGDEDGVAGEADDHFVVEFTGSQEVVLSRQHCGHAADCGPDHRCRQGRCEPLEG